MHSTINDNELFLYKTINVNIFGGSPLNYGPTVSRRTTEIRRVRQARRSMFPRGSPRPLSQGSGA